MLRSILLKTLRDRRRGLLFWSIGVALLSALMIVFYPTIRDSAAAIEQYMEIFPQEIWAMFGGNITEYTTPEGFLNAELLFLTTPILLLIFTIGFGSGAIAGEEEQGTLDLLLSNPIARWRVVLEKFAAMFISTLLLAFVFWAALAIGGNTIDMSLNLGRLGAACFSAALLGIAYGSVALAVSAARGRRGLSIGVAGALGVIGYLLNAMAPIIDWLEPYQNLSPFYYYISSDPLNNGLHAGHTGILLGLTALFLVVALVTFRKRDLAV